MANDNTGATKPRYYIATLGSGDETPTPHRHNDGSMIIMEADVVHRDGDEEWTENVARLTVSRWTPAKRGEAWKTPDPKQEAFAQLVVDALNAQVQA